MAEQHIRQSIDGSQNIFEKSLSRYREMLFENHPSKSVPRLYFDVWEDVWDSVQNYLLSNHAEKLYGHRFI